MDDRLEFGRLFTWLSSLGLSHRDNVDENAYWVYLRDLPVESIRYAFLKAPGKCNRFFPTASQLREISESHFNAKRAAEVPKPKPEEWVDPKLPQDNPFMRLASKWEQESHSLCLDPEKPTPKNIAKIRIEELMGLLGTTQFMNNL